MPDYVRDALAVQKLLVANRGEIALRIFRACHELGIEPVAVVAPDDHGSLHARSEGEPIEIRSYLDSEEHIRAAKESGADAIHPGYGFLAENADFAEAVDAAGLVFVGPSAEALRLGGDKLEAKRIAAESGVPVVPTGEPDEVGYPLIVKAAAGGGGRGMRVVREPSELEEALQAAKREAKAAFGDDRVFCERYVERPRHVEIQLLADAHGTVLSLGERDCSVQRRHQKVLEESPSPALDPELRAEMGAAAIAFARAIGYQSAGTAEFMLAGREFWFLELNGRIQVEHPVTELVTGVDLVREQLRVAAGERLSVSETQARGHAVEVRCTEAQRLHTRWPITWIDDSLPDLDRVHERGERYDVVMLTAVWMHLDAGQRERAMARVAPLVRPRGLMALSLRHGPVPTGRRMFEVSAQETCELARRHGLATIHESKGAALLGGPAVWWDRLAFRAQR